MGKRARSDSVGVVDLARELGVSTATVSRALNGSPAVRPEQAERIRSHAAARGYVPNRLAKGLSASRSRAFVGFVVPYVDTPAYSTVAAECARLLSTDGTQMILTITENDPERELRQLREMTASRVAGLIISPSAGILEESRTILGALPVVELHRACGIRAPGVFSDDEQALIDAVAHLTELGHSEIAYVGTPRELSHGAIRLRAVRRGMELAGLDPDRMPIRLLEPTRQNGRAATAELLAMPNPPTALLVGGGALSVGAAEVVCTCGFRVPDELSLIVYGDPEWFALSNPSLTTLRVSYAELARTAARLLSEALDARESGVELAAERHLITPEFRLGGSTAPPSGHPRFSRVH